MCDVLLLYVVVLPDFVSRMNERKKTKLQAGEWVREYQYTSISSSEPRVHTHRRFRCFWLKLHLTQVNWEQMYARDRHIPQLNECECWIVMEEIRRRRRWRWSDCKLIIERDLWSRRRSTPKADCVVFVSFFYDVKGDIFLAVFSAHLVKQRHRFSFHLHRECFTWDISASSPKFYSKLLAFSKLSSRIAIGATCINVITNRANWFTDGHRRLRLHQVHCALDIDVHGKFISMN